MRGVASWLILPGLPASAPVGLAIAVDHGIPVVVILAMGGLAYAIAIAGLERWRPHAREWQRPRGDVVTDAAHLVVTGWLVGSIPSLVLDGPVLEIWPDAVPLAAQVALALIVKDGFVYGAHRLLHAALWRVHAIHHSAPRLYWLNTWRAHPIEGLVSTTVGLAPLFVAGAPPTVILYVFAFSSIFAMVQHSNVELGGGVLDWIFATPRQHRWHHSRDPAEASSNYGGILIVWDLAFGTRMLPDRPPPIDVGVDAETIVPAGYLAQLVAPFGRRASSASTTR